MFKGPLCGLFLCICFNVQDEVRTMFIARTPHLSLTLETVMKAF